MTTLFQLHADIDTLKHKAEELAQLWQAGDQILLMSTSLTLTDWLEAYITDINIEIDEVAGAQVSGRIEDIDKVYVLQTDFDKINSSAKANLNFSQFKLAQVQVISDSDWVAVTQAVDRVVTLF